MCPHIQNTIDKLMYAVQVSVNQIYSNKRLFLVPQNQNTKGRTFVLKLTKPHIVAYRTLSQVRPRGVDYVTAVHWNTVDLNSDPPVWKRPCCMWTDGTRTHTHTVLSVYELFTLIQRDVFRSDIWSTLSAGQNDLQKNSPSPTRSDFLQQ